MSRSVVDLTENPVRLARKRLGKTVEEAANGAGINWQTWYLTECGCYEHIPPAVLRFFESREIGLDSAQYREFQMLQQKRFGESCFRGKELPLANIFIPPLQGFREHVGIRSRAAFAKGLCVQVSHLYKLEHGLSKHLPAQVYNALLVAGLPVEDVEELNERTVEYYEAVRCR